MKTVAELIRTHLLSHIAPLDALPIPVTLEFLDHNAAGVERFDLLCRNRLRTGYLRYRQPLRSGERGQYRSIDRAIDALRDYLSDGNQEHLVDAANLCKVEFVLPACHNAPHFTPVDDGQHTVRQPKRKPKVAVKRYVVQLGPGVWLQRFAGHFSKLTKRIERAQRFSRAMDARGALTRARRLVPFPDAKITEVES